METPTNTPAPSVETSPYALAMPIVARQGQIAELLKSDPLNVALLAEHQANRKRITELLDPDAKRIKDTLPKAQAAADVARAEYVTANAERIVAILETSVAKLLKGAPDGLLLTINWRTDGQHKVALVGTAAGEREPHDKAPNGTVVLIGPDGAREQLEDGKVGPTLAAKFAEIGPLLKYKAEGSDKWTQRSARDAWAKALPENAVSLRGFSLEYNGELVSAQRKNRRA